MIKNLVKRYSFLCARPPYMMMAAMLAIITLFMILPAMHSEACDALSPVEQCQGNYSKNLILGEQATPAPRLNGPLYLSRQDIETYKAIFDVQEQGQWEKADTLIEDLENDILLGYVQYQRYMHPKSYTSTYEELATWLKNYADHPSASKVYSLALKRKGSDTAPEKPIKTSGIRGSLDISNISSRNFVKQTHSPTQRRLIKNIVRSVRQDIKKGQVTFALNRLQKQENRSLLSQLEYDTLLGEIAAGYMHFGELEKALDLAMTAAQGSGKAVPLANWVAGLSAWKLEEYATAAFHFEQTAQSKNATPWTASAGAYWAARVYKQTNKKRKAKKWLENAAQYNRTFYGLIATSALNKKVSFRWDSPNLTAEKLEALKENTASERALALIDLGKTTMAEKELRRIHPNGNMKLAKALVAISNIGGMPGLSMRIGSAIKAPDGGLYDAALYPMAPWQSDHTYGVDAALVNAFIRQESRFDPHAQNGRSGASGLMQLMPRTASSLSKNISYSSNNSHLLLDPTTNISLGRQYISHLLGQRRINGNLFLLAAAYNAGPGNLAKWQRQIDYNDDPLYFIESIPVSETRGFVERVMTNYWIYRIRMGQPVPSLDMIAKDHWPLYNPLDDHDMQMASSL